MLYRLNIARQRVIFENEEKAWRVNPLFFCMALRYLILLLLLLLVVVVVVVVVKKLKQSRYTPRRRLGGEEI
jgi:hypothetical protein